MKIWYEGELIDPRYYKHKAFKPPNDDEWGTLKNKFKSLDEKNLTEIDLIAGLVKRRKEKGLSQRDLAELTGLKQSSIARIERDIVMPKLDTFIKIATSLDLKLELVPKKKR